MSIRKRRLGAGIFAATLWIAAASAKAQSDAQDGAFVEHRLAIQLSDRDVQKQKLVLSVAYNVLKAFGPDKVAIDVVAFGPGIDLLRADNRNSARIDSLVSQGVRFDVCGNTVETIERETGKIVTINKNAHLVAAGVPRIMELAEEGYTLVRP